jgi:hypothetical protein
LILAHIDDKRIKNDGTIVSHALGTNVKTVLNEMALNESSHTSDLLRYGLEAVWPMIDGVKCAHIREKCLSCTNIACRLFSTNVLLSGLQSQSQSTIAQSVF